jgi:ABC-type arginine/histidine transport system permease subunit
MYSAAAVQSRAACKLFEVHLAAVRSAVLRETASCTAVSATLQIASYSARICKEALQHRAERGRRRHTVAAVKQ